VQRTKRGLLHCPPRGYQPAGPLHDRVLPTRYDHRRAPAITVSREREVAILACQAVLNQADLCETESPKEATKGGFQKEQ
jgi:hypothetical protein